MEIVRVRDVKKVLRLSGWDLVQVFGNSFFYVHPAVPEVFTIRGKDSDVICPALLRVMERQLGLCFGTILA